MPTSDITTTREDSPVSTLIAIDYPDVATAETVRDKLFQLQKQQLITLQDAVVVEHRQDGKIKLHQSRGTTGVGALWGGLWGGLIGLIFFMPLVGMALGAGVGAATGAMTDLGIDDGFMKELSEKLQPGTAALFLLVDDATEDKVLPEVAQYGGQIVRTSLSNESEQQLKDALAAAGKPQN